MEKFVVKQKRKSPEPSIVTRSPEKKSKMIEEKPPKKSSEDVDGGKRKTSVRKLEAGPSTSSSEIAKEKKKKEKEVKKEIKDKMDVWLGKSDVPKEKKPVKKDDISKEKSPREQEKPAKKVEVLDKNPVKKAVIPKEKSPKSPTKAPRKPVVPKESKPGTSSKAAPEASQKQKSPRKNPGPSNSSKLSPELSEDMKKKNQLRTADQLPEGINQIGNLLPSIRGKVISDEDMDKLVLALCGDTGKTFDSDDSILSDIDRMDDEEIAERDRKFRQTIDYLDELPNKMEALNAVLNQGNETKEEREERRRVLRDLRAGYKTKEEKDRAERRRVREVEKMKKMLKTNVQVFGVDIDKKTELKETAPLISCSQFAGFLELMAEFAPNDKKSTAEGGNVDFRAQIKNIKEELLEKKIQYCPIRGRFFTEEKTISEYLKKKVRKILLNPDILDVLDGHRFGFEFSTKDCLLVLENYYSMNKPTKDNGLTAKPLQINIAKLIRSAFHVARSDNPRFVLNDALKMAMFD